MSRQRDRHRHRIAALLRAGLVGGLLALAVPAARAQGEVAKPLQPARTATERVVIRHLPYVINVPGRYVLAGGLSALPRPEKGSEFGIAIVCDDVELDLDGAILAGAEGCTSGIVAILTGKREELFDVTVRNGSLRDWPGWGVDLGVVRQARVQDVHALNNGLADPVARVTPGGLRVGTAGRITGCSAVRNAGSGLVVGNGGLVSDSTSDENGDSGIVLGAGAVATDCAATRNTEVGFLLDGAGARASGCSAASNRHAGLSAARGGVMERCSATDNGAWGFVVLAGCRVTGSMATDNGQGGILATAANNRIESNHVASPTGGIEVRGANNLVVGNSVSGSPMPYTIAERNLVGPIHRAATGPDALIIRQAGALDGTGTALVDPPPAWANFAH